LLRVLGEALFYPPTDEPCKEFPSPESLKGRIIISTKPPKEYLEAPPVGDKAAAKALAKEDKQDAKQSSPLKEETLSEKVEKFHIDQVIIPSQSCNLCTEMGMVMYTIMFTCFSVSFHIRHTLMQMKGSASQSWRASQS
jgi:hypothetical protein